MAARADKSQHITIWQFDKRKAAAAVAAILLLLCLTFAMRHCFTRQPHKPRTAHYPIAGLQDVQSVQLPAAQEHGLNEPLPDRERDFDTIPGLTRIATCNDFRVDSLTHSVPYLTADAANLLHDIGTRFQQKLADEELRKHRIIVTSVLRTTQDVARLQKSNRNAVKTSAHCYATTFDITYARYERLSTQGEKTPTAELTRVLGEVLLQLRREKRCYVMMEQHQTCFHITCRTGVCR